MQTIQHINSIYNPLLFVHRGGERRKPPTSCFQPDAPRPFLPQQASTKAAPSPPSRNLCSQVAWTPCHTFLPPSAPHVRICSGFEAQVLSFLDFDQLLRLRLVCRRWKRLAERPEVWRHIAWAYLGSREARELGTPDQFLCGRALCRPSLSCVVCASLDGRRGPASILD